MGLISDEQLAHALAEQQSMQVINLGDTKLPPDVISKLTEAMAQMYRVVPVHFDGNTLTVATCDPQNLNIQDELRTFLGYDIRMVVATERDIQAAVDKYYSSELDTFERVVQDLASDQELEAAAKALAKEGAFNLTDAEALADSVPVRKLLNMVLLLAIKDHASDIHFEPFEDDSAFGLRRKVCCMKWCRHHVTWPSPLRRASKLWPTWILPNAACRRTVVLS